MIEINFTTVTLPYITLNLTHPVLAIYLMLGTICFVPTLVYYAAKRGIRADGVRSPFMFLLMFTIWPVFAYAWLRKACKIYLKRDTGALTRVSCTWYSESRIPG